MKHVGSRKQVIGAEDLAFVAVHSSPYMLPKLPEGHYLLCGLGPAESCELFYCVTPADMIECVNAAKGRSVHWFSCQGNLVDMSGSSKT